MPTQILGHSREGQEGHDALPVLDPRGGDHRVGQIEPALCALPRPPTGRLKAIYTAVDRDAAEQELERFAERWDQR